MGHIRKKSRRTLTVASALAGLLVIAACGSNDSGPDDAGDDGAQPAGQEAEAESPAGAEFEEMTLTYASFVNKENPHSVAHQWWMDEVTERTGGAVTFDAVWDGALCGSGEMTECVGDGRTDIGFSTPLRNPAELPIANFVAVPFQSDNNEALVRAYRDMYQESEELQAEYADYGQRVLYFTPVGLPLFGMNTEINDISDLDGLSLRGVGQVTTYLEDLGVNPVSILEPEVYESLQRGVVDGVAWTIDGMITYGVYEIMDYGYNLHEYTGQYAAMHTTINGELWDGLDPALQDVINEVNEDLVDRIISEFFDPADVEACETLSEHLESFERLPSESEFQAWADESSEVALGEWVDSAADAMDDPQAFADRYQEVIEKYESEFDYQGPGDTCLEVFN